LNRKKTEAEKTGAFQTEAHGKFPVEPEKPARIIRFRFRCAASVDLKVYLLTYDDDADDVADRPIAAQGYFS